MNLDGKKELGIGRKEDVAKMLGYSKRWVDDRMRFDGMPHFKTSPRSVRFDLNEVLKWFKETYAVRRMS